MTDFSQFNASDVHTTSKLKARDSEFVRGKMEKRNRQAKKKNDKIPLKNNN